MSLRQGNRAGEPCEKDGANTEQRRKPKKASKNIDSSIQVMWSAVNPERIVMRH